MEVDSENLVCECGNKDWFFYDFQNGELVCCCCGVVHSEVQFRENFFIRKDI